MVLRDFWQAEARAAEVLRKNNISTVPVNPFVIARNENILCYEFEAIAAGISGCLMKMGDAFGIFYSDRFPTAGFRRFTVAHELGHYFLSGHIDYVFPQGTERHESESGFVSEDRYEREADAFAAALLMPEKPFRAICARVQPGLKAIEALSEQCGTSLTATAIRYTQLSEDPVIVICSEDNRVKFAFMSGPMRARRGLTWIAKNSGIPEHTETFRFNNDPKNVSLSKRSTSRSRMDSWFDCGGSLEVVEEVVGLGSYGKTLTVLWGESLFKSEEEEEDSEEREPEIMLPSDRWRLPRDD